MSGNIIVYVVGTAGCGKSTLVYAFQQWMSWNGYDAITVNLDPGAEDLKYTPDVDVREIISLKEIINEYQLGPNGAQIAAADMLAIRIGEIKELIDGYETDYVLVDTPGQIELFAFRVSSDRITETLNKDKSVILYLYDPILSLKPSGFVSLILLGSIINFRFDIPTINVLSKSDLVNEEQLNTILKWNDCADELLNACMTEKPSMRKEISINMFRTLNDLGVAKILTPVSSETFNGMEDIYFFIQNIFMAGEDIE